MLAIEVKELCKSFGIDTSKVDVLKKIDFSVEIGDFVSIMGPSGSGKSTLLYLIGGLDKPNSGSIKIKGREISNMNEKEISRMRRKDIGFIFQFYNLIPNLNVEDNIFLPVLLDGKKVKDYKKDFDEIIEIVGLADRKRYLPRELSGGQQQRVAIARALINKPGIILADEATGNLDSVSGTEILNLFKEINRKSKITIVQVTHSREAAEYGNKIINLKDGKIVSQA